MPGYTNIDGLLFLFFIKVEVADLFRACLLTVLFLFFYFYFILFINKNRKLFYIAKNNKNKTKLFSLFLKIVKTRKICFCFVFKKNLSKFFSSFSTTTSSSSTFFKNSLKINKYKHIFTF